MPKEVISTSWFFWLEIPTLAALVSQLCLGLVARQFEKAPMDFCFHLIQQSLGLLQSPCRVGHGLFALVEVFIFVEAVEEREDASSCAVAVAATDAFLPCRSPALAEAAAVALAAPMLC